MQVEKSITVNKSVATVFAELNCFDQWQYWCPMDSMLDHSIRTYSDNPCGKGAWVSWNGGDKGEVKCVLRSLEEDELLGLELTGFNHRSHHAIDIGLKPLNGLATVTWKMKCEEEPLLRRPLNLVYRHQLNEFVANALTALKNRTEALPKVVNDYEIFIRSISNKNCLFIRRMVNKGELDYFLRSAFVDLENYVSEKRASVTQVPIAVFYGWSDSVVDVAALVITDRKIKTEGELQMVDVNYPEAIIVTHNGGLSNVGDGHYVVENYMRENGLESVGLFYEAYKVGYYNETDSNKWQTDLVYPVKGKE